MPWSNQSGGPWGQRGGGSGGGGGPWGAGPQGGGGGGQPPDLEQILRRGQDRLKDFIPGGSMGGRGLLVAVLAAIALWLAFGFYTVRPDQVGINLIFGKYTGKTGEGLRYNLPYPIGNVVKPSVTAVNTVQVGYRTAGPQTRAGRDVPEESLMLTGDENIVDINFVLLWQIKDAGQFLFNVRDPETTVKAVAESVMREIIGKTPIVEATTEGRGAIELAAREQTQQILDEYGAGILVTQVQLQKVDPPSEVIDAFRDVQRAQADRERLQNEAEAFANDILPRARGEAERLLQEAQAYRQEVVARADGDAQRFVAVYDEYVKAQDVTVRRIYLETMEDVLRDMNKVLIDGSASGSGVVPYLPLPELERRARERGIEAPAEGEGEQQ
jgi:modulator of FtsH protease HflK